MAPEGRPIPCAPSTASCRSIHLEHERSRPQVYLTTGVKLRGPEGAQRLRATSAAGWPQGIAPPGLPRIRTCGFPASGSSSHGFAIPDAIRPSCVEMLCGLSVPWTRCSSTFPPDGSVTRSPLPYAGSLGQLSQRSRVLWVTPTPQRPSRFASVVPSLSGTGASLDLAGGVGVSCVPGEPLDERRLLRLRWDSCA